MLFRSASVSMNQKQQERMEQIEMAQERYVEALKDPTLFTADNNGNNSLDKNNLRRNGFDTIQPEISSATRRAIHEVVLLYQMTEIQFRTYTMAVNGTSLLGRARTGTGKVSTIIACAFHVYAHSGCRYNVVLLP